MTRVDMNELGPSELPTPSVDPARGARPALLRYLPLAVIVALLALGYAFGLQDRVSLAALGERRDELRAYVDANFGSSLATYLAIYTLAAAVAFPAQAVLSVIGGFLFGWLVGGASILIGATVGASILFLATRSAFGGFLRRRGEGVAARTAQGFRENAVGYLLALRLAPVVPFFLVTIAAALFDIRLRSFVLATFVGILPAVFAYAWLGQGLDSVLAAAREMGREPKVADLVTPEITIAFCALAAVAALPPLVRWVRRRRG